MKNSKFFENLLSLVMKFKTEPYRCRNGIYLYLPSDIKKEEYQKDLEKYNTRDPKVIFETLRDMINKKDVELTEENLLIQLNPKKKKLEEYQRIFTKKENAILRGESPLQEINDILEEFSKDHPDKKLFVGKSD